MSWATIRRCSQRLRLRHRPQAQLHSGCSGHALPQLPALSNKNRMFVQFPNAFLTIIAVWLTKKSLRQGCTSWLSLTATYLCTLHLPEPFYKEKEERDGLSVIHAGRRNYGAL